MKGLMTKNKGNAALGHVAMATEAAEGQRSHVETSRFTPAAWTELFSRAGLIEVLATHRFFSVFHA